MCDTSLATEKFTGSTRRVFAKNSDREPNEAQAILHQGRMNHPAGSLLKTTFISIPQVPTTYEVLLSKPFQMWGAEIGVNENGVAIGNEAVFTNLKKPKRNEGLTGMDLIRLTLERSNSAVEALETITSLLETYGQDACGGYEDSGFFYHNSFIISDGSNGFVLETADKFWVAKKIETYYAISNGLTIESDYSYSSKSLEDKITKMGLRKKGEEFSFRKAFSDKFYTKMSHCQERRSNHETNAVSLAKKTNTYSAQNAMKVLRSHSSDDSRFEVRNSDMNSICMHATGLFTPSNTNGSLVVEWDTSPKSPAPFRVFYTGTSNPCLSVFKPFFFGTKNLQNHSLLSPGSSADGSLWWNHEKISRRANFDYQSVSSLMMAGTDKLEEKYYRESINSLTDQKKSEIQLEALEENAKFQDKILKELQEKRIGHSLWTSPVFQIYWKNQNNKAGLMT
ncbi:MAG: C69 family dipeptidase [Leptospira sp.]|nr:C69 family dipeptidase [Leptospira sp.]